jgi:hypothetical protein
VKEQGDIAPTREAVHESVDPWRVADGLELGGESRGARTDPRKEALEASANRRDAAVGEARGNQSDDLPILRIVKPPDDPHRIALDEAPVVAPA